MALTEAGCWNTDAGGIGLDADVQPWKWLIFCFKDVVQPKKRGVKMGIIWTVMTSHTIADIFLTHLKGYSFDLNRKKPFSAFNAKKTWIPLIRDVRCQKTQKRIVMLRDSPCMGRYVICRHRRYNDRWCSATNANKKEYFFKLVAILHVSPQIGWRYLTFCHMGCPATSSIGAQLVVDWILRKLGLYIWHFFTGTGALEHSINSSATSQCAFKFLVVNIT